VEALCIEMGEVRKVGGVRDSLACATRLPGTLLGIHFLSIGCLMVLVGNEYLLRVDSLIFQLHV
jgi:hypothetical protein